jgi:hypothetical protein
MPKLKKGEIIDYPIPTLRISFNIILILLGMISFFIKDDIGRAFFYYWEELPTTRLLFTVISLFIFSVGLFNLLLDYLKGNIFPFPTSNSKLSGNSVNIKSLQALRFDIRRLQNSYKEFLEKSSSSNSKEIDIDVLTKSIREQVLSQLPQQLITDLENKFATKSIDSIQINLIRDNLADTSIRLGKEIAESSRRSSVNLAIGIATTALAAGILAYIAFETKPIFESITILLAHYIPRITTIIFVEVFAFFFLRLYKTGLQEIKYFQNELTNIELQAIAIEASLLQKYNKSMEAIIQQLMKTERNPINQIGAKDTDIGNNLSVKDVGTIAETISKISGKH